MGHFRTEDDYPQMDMSDYSSGYDRSYYGYDNPEIGNDPNNYGSIKKPGIISKLSNGLGSFGAGKGKRTGITLEKVVFVLYLIAMIFVVINIRAVLNFLFYATVPILKYLVVVLVLLLLGYLFFRFVLHRDRRR